MKRYKVILSGNGTNSECIIFADEYTYTFGENGVLTFHKRIKLSENETKLKTVAMFNFDRIAGVVELYFDEDCLPWEYDDGLLC